MNLPFRIIWILFILLAHLNRIRGLQRNSYWNGGQVSPAPGSYEYKHKYILGPSREDILGWEVDWYTNTITLTVSSVSSSQTTGRYLAVGISKGGQVAGADVVVGGRWENNEPFLIDMYGVDNHTLVEDASQDWELLKAESAYDGRSVLSVSRNLDTCDNWQDILINSDLLHVIYGFVDFPSYSSTNSIHFIPQGGIRAYLLDPVIRAQPESDIRTWRLTRRLRVPNRHTTYWCTIHKGFPERNKNHIVGYTTYFNTERARRSVHHQLVYRCTTPRGVSASSVFERFVNHPGEECYLESVHQLPTILCSEALHIYGAGGDRPFIFPNDIGIPIGGENEYYMYETHINRELNEIGDELIIETGVEFQYTSQLRREEGSIFYQGYGVFGLFLIPPQTQEFNVTGHCSPSCTREVFPSSGVEVVATMLHAHRTARKLYAKHYRGNRELPWINSDANYEFDFQELRLLRERRTIMPGDQFSSECTHDTRGRDFTTVQGFSIRDEMCATFILVNKRLPWLACTSETSADWYLLRYGIDNVEWDVPDSERRVRAALNATHVGMTLSDVVDQSENWTEERIDELENHQFFGEHQSICPNIQQLPLIATAGIFLDNLSGGLLQRTMNFRPTTRTFGSPLEGRSASTPTGGESFTPIKRMCPVHS